MLVFGKRGADFGLSDAHGAAFAALLPPAVRTDGGEMLPLAAAADGTYIGHGFAVRERAADLGGGLCRVTRCVRNTTDGDRRIQLRTTLRDAFVRDHYVIPCVNYNGNPGGGNYTHGFAKDGKPWIFAYDRTGIPSCSLTEDASRVVALFAADTDETSLVSSVSLTENPDGSLDHHLYYPYIESPYSYTNTDTLTAPYETFLAFAPGEEKIFTFYIFVGAPKWKNFGMASLIDRLDELHNPDLPPATDARTLWDAGIDYIGSLRREYRGRGLFASARRADFGAPVFAPPAASFEIGWAGQGALNSQLYICEYLRTGERHFLDAALENLDAWAEKQAENGLFLAHYEWYPAPGEPAWRPAVSDTKILANFHIPGGTNKGGKGWYPELCNLGWGAASFARCYMLLHGAGIDRPDYLAFARRTCDFFCEHFDEENGFGKAYRFDGSSFDATGTIGAFALPALIEVYRATGEKKYLDGAVRGFDFYARRDLDAFSLTAGAIDCASVDKETVWPLFRAALDLFDETGDAAYRTRAEMCAYYFDSWTYRYDALYPATSDFARYGYHTRGGTAVSVQHHAIDSWGSLAAPEFVRLWRATGDARWFARARALWHNATLCIALDDKTVINGTLRPRGGQNEAFFGCRWTRYRPVEERGHFNNWLISWVNAYRLYAIHTLGFDHALFQVEENACKP